ncbi:DUF2605 family protein [Vulcanococcus sp.]|uniref:DUF2605 family protein n=1 Tax=Vulcanococcus sp. TaxID=2856995 RepID=UPI003BFBD7D6
MSESSASGPMDRAEPQSESAELLDHLLESLFDDFRFWFRRGLELLDHTPEQLLPASEQSRLRDGLEEALQAIVAAKALRSACSTPMAVDMEAMAPWHRLMMRVWNLSAMLRVAGVPIPEAERPEVERPEPSSGP